MSPETGDFAVRQEDDAIAGGRLARIAVFAVAVGLMGVALSALLLETNTGGIRGHLPVGASPRPAGPEIAHIEQTPLFGAAEGLELRRRQREELSRYRWVDRDAGLVAIPIERAMDVVAEEAR
jgi:hypothetical protein